MAALDFALNYSIHYDSEYCTSADIDLRQVIVSVISEVFERDGVMVTLISVLSIEQ